jgi:D-alanyl-D-alanine carboxypeptidase (penicillin-binding protein 5/6)
MGRSRLRPFAVCVAALVAAGLGAATALGPAAHAWRVMAQASPTATTTQPPFAIRRPLPPGAQPALPIPVFATLAPPEVATAKAGVLLDADTGHALWARDAGEPRSIASLTKIFTAMEAVSLVSNLDQPVIVPRSAVTDIPWDSTVMGLTPGETVSVRDLLYGMFLPSGNDAAVTLAQTILPESRFIEGMNGLAGSLGLRETHFTNPWGADDPGHHSSAFDLALAATYLEAHFPQLAAIAATESIAIPAGPGHKAYHLRTLNKLLDSYPGATGLKTGWTGGAGGCLISTASRDGHHLVAVLLGSENTFVETRSLLDYGFSLEDPVSQR